MKTFTVYTQYHSGHQFASYNLIFKLLRVDKMASKPLRVASLTIAIGTGAVLIFWRLWKYARKKEERNRYIKEKRILLVDTAEEWEHIYPVLMQEIAQIKVLGMDCEWVQKNPVALLQLGSPQGLCILIRLFKMKCPLPHTLLKLLADKSVIKVGVAVNDDGKKLLLDYNCQVRGCVDLRFLLKRVRGAFKCQSKGLQGLAKGILGLDLSKDHNVRCGNWESEKYTQQQKDYAAADAAAAVDIFLRLVRTKLEMSESNNTLNHSSNEDNQSKEQINLKSLTEEKDTSYQNMNKNSSVSLEAVNNDDCDTLSGKVLLAVENVSNSSNQPILSSDKQMSNNNLDLYSPKNISNTEDYDNLWKMARSMCQGLTEVPFSSNLKGGGMPGVSSNKNKQKVGADGPIHAYSFRSRKLWDNCRLLAPDDTPLCTCESRKAQWYIYKGLGDKVCDDPLTVRLRFEPSGRPSTEKNYYLQDKENICVVCGHDKDYVRKFVIPYEYRKFFPNALKDHSSHDVLLLCTPCHRRSCDLDSHLRLQLAQECEAPLESGTMAKTVLDRDLQQIRSAGRALKTNKETIPEARVVQLEKVLLDFYGVDDLTEDLIEQACSTDARQISEDYVPHGKRVVRHMIANGGLLAFMTRWRQHFIDAMDPQFLPTFWSVDFVPDGWKRSL